MSSAVAASASSRPEPLPSTTALDACAIRHVLRAGRTNGASDWHVSVVQKTASTNSDLLAAIRAGRFRAPALLVAEHQTAGRGRLGRVWNSAAGASLTVSFALPIDRPLSALDGVTLACGLAACDAIAVHGVEARLKWPNDLLVDGRKLAGILVEVVPVAQGTVLIVGVGVNVGPGDGLVSRGLTAIDLKTAGGSALDRNRLAAELGRALEARLAAFESSGFASCVDEWNGRDAFRDQAVTLQAGSDPCITGIERGVDVGGALLVDTPDQGRRRIVSGDLSLRLAMAR